MSNVLRKHASQECGEPVGQMHIKLSQTAARPYEATETVSFYCTKPKLHRDACAFVGKELIVTRIDQRSPQLFK